MNIKFYPYTLENKESNKQTARKGALLRVTFEDSLVGYTDCHPWPEIGDLPLDEQLKKIQKKTPTLLTRCSLRFARIDAEARSKRNCLLDYQKIPNSHFLINDLLNCVGSDLDSISLQGFTHVKIKVGRSLPQEINKLHGLFKDRDFKVRLDFNEKIKKEEFFSFLNVTQALHEHFDFIEDPFAYHPRDWKECQEKYGIQLACDKQALAARDAPDSAAFLVLKPAVQEIDHFKECRKERIIITSYLGHPLGQTHAAFIASQFDPEQKMIHGLQSHYSYKNNRFSEYLSQTGAKFQVPHGYGFGFDQLLEELEWQNILF